MIQRFLALSATLLLFKARIVAQFTFEKIEGKQFVIDGKRYYNIGASYWYGAIIASSGSYGDLPSEEQNLNSVFSTDSTIPFIEKYNQEKLLIKIQS